MIGVILLFVAIVLLLAAMALDARTPALTTCERCSGEYAPAKSNAWSPNRFCSAYCEGNDDDDVSRLTPEVA